jgi:ABC transporter with metal-binding/Fe-S-binding domain ATP-binding protein
MKKQKAAVLFSGGKDSCLALHKAKKKYEIRYLLSVMPKNPDSFMFHKPDLGLLERQAEMLNVDLVVMRSEGKEEEEVEDLRKLVEKVKKKVDVVVVGGIASSYQGKRIKKICDEEGLEFYAPLWDYKGERVWKELLDNGFKVIISKVSCEGLDEKWLGKIIDEKKYEKLRELSKKYGFRIDFEGGEAETAVLFMLGFKEEIKIEFEVRSDGEYRHFLEFKEIK